MITSYEVFEADHEDFGSENFEYQGLHSEVINEEWIAGGMTRNRFVGYAYLDSTTENTTIEIDSLDSAEIYYVQYFLEDQSGY